MKRNKTNAEIQLEMSKRCGRKMLQDMHRPMCIPNKKKQADKMACRRMICSV